MPTEPSEPPAATHTVTFRVTYSASYGYTVKTMTVEDGYALTAADYPTTYGVTWQQYTSPITSDVTVNGTYSWGGYGAAEEAEATGEIAAEAAAESTAVSRTGSTTLVKTVTETYDYVYNGGRLSQVKKTTSTTTSSGTTNATDTLNFTYDANGTPMSVKYNNTNYYYVTNLQGDVTAILNTSGTAVASYTYDAWGNILTTGGSMASTLGTLNPLRYRGYVYDTETGLYYLQSRYYNPELSRFNSADALVATGQGLLGNNLFTYCGNNPVIYFDPVGNRLVAACGGGGSLWHELIGPWRYRIDPKRPETKTQKHIHIQHSRTKEEYIQNDDGSPHDQGKGQGGKLPNKVQKALMEKVGWDYNGKREQFFNKTSMTARDDGILYVYADGTQVFVPFSPFLLHYTDTSTLESYYFGHGVKPTDDMLVSMPIIEPMWSLGGVIPIPVGGALPVVPVF